MRFQKAKKHLTFSRGNFARNVLIWIFQTVTVADGTGLKSLILILLVN